MAYMKFQELLQIPCSMAARLQLPAQQILAKIHDNAKNIFITHLHSNDVYLPTTVHYI